jgi:hypothetical protein
LFGDGRGAAPAKKRKRQPQDVGKSILDKALFDKTGEAGIRVLAQSPEQRADQVDDKERGDGP